MSKKILLYIFIFLYAFNFAYDSYSLDTISTKYFPLKLGNKWVFSWYSTQWGQSGRFSVKLTQTENLNNHLYFQYRTYLLRVDSINGNVMEYTTSQGCPWSINEQMRDSLSAKLYDTIRYNCLSNYKTLADTNLRTLFGSLRRTKNFRLGNNGIIYARDFGVMEFYTQSGMVFYVEHLIGCIINGILYGDTSLTSIKTVTTEIPNDFVLHQNYPNPFNPRTKIRFNIPKLDSRLHLKAGGNDNTLLNIYNSLGQEIQTLVNENLSAGTYEVEWDGTDYPSGVYFYQLRVNGDMIETKKMVLLK